MPAVIDVSQGQILDDLKVFLTGLLGTAEVWQTQVNQVSQPLADCVMMTVLRRTRLATDEGGYLDPAGQPQNGAYGLQMATQADVQLDCYGESADEWSQIINTVWRSMVACDSLAATAMQPLYSTDPMNMPFVGGEQQYQNRWTLTVSLQYNPVVSTPMQFADSVAVGLIEVDTTYPA